MTRGVSKSGSPTPRLMTSSIVAVMSKKRRIPDGGTTRTRSARTRSASGARASRSVVIVGTGYGIESGKRPRRWGTPYTRGDRGPHARFLHAASTAAIVATAPVLDRLDAG